MRVVIHGGMQKAGSSAVQEYLHTARDALRDAGVIYPDFGHREHWMVTAAFVPKPESYHHVRQRFRGDDLTAAIAGVREELARIVPDGRDGETLLLSHEDLSVRRSITRMEAFFAEVAGRRVETIFTAYVRHPVPMYPSVIQQSLKSYRDRDFLPSDWLNPHIKRAEGFRNPIRSRMVLRPFAPPGTAGWDVIEDFRALFASLTGQKLPPPEPQTGVNSSMSWEACAVLELARGVPDARTRLKGLPGIVRGFDAKRRGSKLRLPEGWAEDIEATNAESWNAILPMLDCADETKAALAIAPRERTQDYSDRDVRRWLVSGLGEEFCRALADECATSDRPRVRQPAIAEWLEREVIGRTDAIRAEI